jgi:NTP pyrophosphatase (non-canonical NTP hydrolase)
VDENCYAHDVGFSHLQEECGEMHKELTDAKRNLEREIQMKEQLQDEVAALSAQVCVSFVTRACV